MKRWQMLLAVTSLLAVLAAIGFSRVAAAPEAQVQVLEAKIQVVWPHSATGQFAAVTAAPLANITANVFLPGTTTSVPCTFNSPVRLWVAVNNEPAVPIAVGTRRFVQVGGSNPYYYPVWDFNDVNVAAANNPNNKIYMYVQVDNALTLANVWIHAANALTFLPNPPQPITAGGTPPNVVGQIQIVFPHDRSGSQAPVTSAPLANVRVALFEQNSMRSVGVNFSNPVFLLKGLNNDSLYPAEVNPGQKMVITENGVTYPVWLFNDVDVSAAMNSANKYAFRVAVQGVGYTSNVWIHGAAAQTFLPNPVTVTGGGCAGFAPGVTVQPTVTPPPGPTVTPTATAIPLSTPTDAPQPTATSIPLPTETPAPPPTETAVPSPTAPIPSVLVGPTWQWIGEMDATAVPTPIPNPQNYTVKFNADGTVNIKADCNSVNGTYTVNGSALTIMIGPTTGAFCGEASLDQKFLQSLQQVVSYSSGGNQLYLQLAGGAGQLQFVAS